MVRKVIQPIEVEELKELAEAIGGFYVKVVVDMKRQILAGGAKMHVDEEQVLVTEGGRKEDLWGGGYDLESKQITFDSIINNKPGINASSDILDSEIRSRFEIIVRRLLNV